MRYLILLLTIPIFSCSTYMENKIGQDFKSIQPDFTNVAPNNTFEGAVYSGGGGLFASDRRANNVGDIITVTLEENITCLLYTSPSPRDRQKSRMPSSA